MTPEFPYTRDLVLIGGGHCHALVLRHWAMRPLPGVRLTLINPAPIAPYSGMLPGAVAGHYDQQDLEIDLIRLIRFAGARFVQGRVVGIDRANKQIHVSGRAPIGYDVVSVNVGVTTEMPTLPGFAEYGIPAKPLAAFFARWQEVLSRDPVPDIAILGAGVAGVELALAMRFAAKEKGAHPKITMLERTDALSGVNESAAKALRAALATADVTVIEQKTVSRVGADCVVLENGLEIASGFTVGTAGARALDWLSEVGVKTQDGYLSVDETLRTSDDAIFAAGDCAHMTHAPRPKAGVYAVRQAPILSANLKAALSGQTLRSYYPQKGFLKLISLGGKVALADRFGRAFSSKGLWRLKNRIDQKFMRQFSELPEMARPELPERRADGLSELLGGAPLCGGCGAKAGPQILRNALDGLRTTKRTDVHTLPGDDAAVLTHGGARVAFTTDHLRAFVSDPGLMARIAANHALGDIWAMGAEPQAALASLTLPRMSDPLQARDLSVIMAEASEVFDAAGAVITGGHTSLGAELSIGFSITGLLKTAPVTLAGAQPGDALMLTKPIGSGTVLAAEMRLLANPKDVAACTALMTQSQAAAAAILSPVATAMTDVTGFGLAGHLSNICRASTVAALLDLKAVPTVPGALDLASKGVRSSLFPQNELGSLDLSCSDTALRVLAFDPQTAGGLLATVPEARANDALKALKTAGYTAARIGQITEGPPALRSV